MFGALALSNQDHFRPEGFWRAFKDYDGEPINVREHQDAYEFFTRLQARACVEGMLHTAWLCTNSLSST